MFPQSLDQLHHATIITGNRVANLALVKKYLEGQGIAVAGNQDVFIVDAESLGVDMVRDEIIPFVTAKKVSQARFVILSFDRTGTHEAQNMLLKSLEEPQQGTHFMILVPKSDVLLPTILSRAQIAYGDLRAGDTRLDVAQFLKSNLAGRFALVEEWTKNKKDEDNLSKTEVINFLDQLEKQLWEQRSKNPLLLGGVAAGRGGISVEESLFADIRQMRQYANIRGASHRVILDFIGMITPVIK